MWNSWYWFLSILKNQYQLFRRCVSIPNETINSLPSYHKDIINWWRGGRGDTPIHTINLAITLTVILLYWCQCPHCYSQIKKSTTLQLIAYYNHKCKFQMHYLHKRDFLSAVWHMSFELVYKNPLKRSVLKSKFQNPRNLDEKDFFYTIHTKTTSNSQPNKK